MEKNGARQKVVLLDKLDKYVRMCGDMANISNRNVMLNYLF